MRRIQKRLFLLAAALVFVTACPGQIVPAPNPNPGPLISVTGRLFDASGAPASGVVVVATPLIQGPNTQSQSDANGKYTLDLQFRPMMGGGQGIVYWLVARDLAHNLAEAHAVDATTTNLDLRLQPGLTISAKIQDGDGKPIPNVSAFLDFFSPTSGIGSLLSLTPINSDDQGRVQFTALPQGYRYSVTLRARGYGTPQVPMIQAAQTQTTRLDLAPVVLKPANLKLAGQVLGADGQPAAAVRVSIAGVGQPTTNTQTDATGHFSVNVCDGPLTVLASAQGAGTRTNTVGGDTNVVLRLASLLNPATTTMALPNNGPAPQGVGHDYRDGV